MKLTGKQRYRTNRRGKLILQVEERGFETSAVAGTVIYTDNVVRWRDATVEDITEKTNEEML